MNLKSILRSAQSVAPLIRPLKFEAYNFGTRFLGRPIEPEFRILSRLRPSSLALDIGGNWGQSIHALKRTARPRQIISFEPNPTLANRLERRFANDRSVEIKKHALSDSEGEFNLYIPKYGKYYYDGLASLNYNEVLNWFTNERFAWFDPNKLNIESYIVKAFTLDSLDIHPDIIKIDVQGSEEIVVRGGVRTFQKYQPITIIECPTENIVNILSRFGMIPYYYHKGRLMDWRHHRMNVIFLTDAHREELSL